MTIFTSGTKTLFQQSSAPTGWTKETVNFNNHALRVVSGATSSGGTLDFTTVFNSTPYSFTGAPFTMDSDATSIANPNIPTHNHPVTTPATIRLANEPVKFFPGAPPFPSPAPRYSTVTNVITNAVAGTTADSATPTGTVWSAGGHAHSLSATASGTVANLNIRYVDVIIATLN
jgi:hypothetical protein